MPTPPIPSTFTRKKARILQDLSVPDNDYSDKSPKGSVDEGIRELIAEINAYEGLVTTSSCAGRISIFLEGSRSAGEGGSGEDEVGRSRVPGGKGGGKFLFVSHDPVVVSKDDGLGRLSEVLGRAGDFDDQNREAGSADEFWDPERRFVRFAFEPMILHVMTASLYHAKPLLTAAINSGFRESGVQSLKNLEDPEACPMVAVRTAGLGLEAIIASIGGSDDDGPFHVRHFVTKEYSTMLLKIANERFAANKQRIDRFQRCLKEAMALKVEREQHSNDWESQEARRRRKREEGLRKKEAANIAAKRHSGSNTHTSSEGDHEDIQLYPND